jgi:hypothetical protein
MMHTPSSYMIRQILRNAPSTPDMLKGTTGGPTVALEVGLRGNLLHPQEFMPLRKVRACVRACAYA